MATTFEFEWCQVQYGRVTYVNGHWAGAGMPDAERMASCPNVWEFLNERGAQGWQVASSHGYEVVVGDAQDPIQVVILQRAKG